MRFDRLAAGEKFRAAGVDAVLTKIGEGPAEAEWTRPNGESVRTSHWFESGAKVERAAKPASRRWRVE